MSTVFHFDFAAGKMVPISAAGLLTVGQVVTYSDMANPQKEFVVIGADLVGGYGQECICEDGHRSQVRRSAVEGIGGWEYDRRGRVLNTAEIAAFLRNASERKARETEERNQQAVVNAKAKEDEKARLLKEWPKLERAEVSKKSRHALGGANLRRVLAKTWPSVAFSVTSRYGCISVGWTDGPTSSAVDAVADQFQECDFDGMDDSTHYRNSVFPELFGGAKYVNASRSVSEAARVGLAAEMGMALTFGKWGCASGFRDWEEEQYFNRTLHARDFLAEPIAVDTRAEDAQEVADHETPGSSFTSLEAQPITPAVHAPVLCW